MPIRISSLHVYPIKSCAGISLDEMPLDERGPVNDRRWMIVDEDGAFLTQREHPRLSLVQVVHTDAGVALSASGMPTLSVSAPREDNGADFNSAVFVDRARVRPASGEAAEWFSTWLSAPVRLVYLPDESRRMVRAEYLGALAREPRHTSLSDGAPILLIGQASLDELNTRLAVPLPMNRFRPNIVVTGGESFAEDAWKRIAAGGVVFEVAKPCARCVTITVDQETAALGREPLRTLATFRRAEDAVIFGQNVTHHGPGTLRVGDEIRVLA